MKIRVPDKKSLNEQAKQVLTAKARKTNFLRKTTWVLNTCWNIKWYSVWHFLQVCVP